MGGAGYSHGTNGIYTVWSVYYKHCNIERAILIAVSFVLITTQRCPLITFVIAIIITVKSIIILFKSREAAGGTVN